MPKLLDKRKPFTNVIIAAGFAIVSAYLCYQVRLYFFPDIAGDYHWALSMARDLLAMKDPYDFIPSALLVPYPLPVVLFGFPFLWLPYKLAAAIFFGLSSGLLAYSILHSDRLWRLLTFVSLPYVYALLFVQWSPLIMATWYIPILAPMLALIKPQTALPIALNRITRKGLILAGVILLLSLLIYPTWPFRWYALTRDFEYIIPIITLPLGPMLLLSAFFWKRPEARVLLISAFLPYRGAYDILPLSIVPQSLYQMIFITVIPWAVSIIWPKVAFNLLKSPHIVPILFLPALLAILWEAARSDPRLRFLPWRRKETISKN